MQFRKLFEFLLPPSWRVRPPARPELNDALLSRLNESDPVYRALMDHAYAAFETCALASFESKLTPDQRSYQAGRAAGLLGYIATVEDTRQRLHEQHAEASRLQNEQNRVKAEQEARREARRQKFRVAYSEAPPPP